MLEDFMVVHYILLFLLRAVSTHQDQDFGLNAVLCFKCIITLIDD